MHWLILNTKAFANNNGLMAMLKLQNNTSKFLTTFHLVLRLFWHRPFFFVIVLWILRSIYMNPLQVIRSSLVSTESKAYQRFISESQCARSVARCDDDKLSISLKLPRNLFLDSFIRSSGCSSNKYSSWKNNQMIECFPNKELPGKT